MLKVGDVVVHPRYGPAVIEKMQATEYQDGIKRYYCLRLERDNDKSLVMIPEDAIDEAGLRTELLSVKNIQEIMCQQPSQLDEDAHKRQKYVMSTVQSGDPHVLIGLLRDLCWLETGKLLSQGESKARKHLLDVLEYEISVSQNVDSPSAQKKLETIIDEAIEGHRAHANGD